MRYWNKVVQSADDHYHRWVIAPIKEKSLITCEPHIPAKFEEIELWLRPRILEAIPTKLKETILQEQQLGMNISVAGMLFRLNVLMQPGNLDEHDSLLRMLTSPNACGQPEAALKELRRWYGAMKRVVTIQMRLPSVELLYRGARSIYSGVFEKEDFSLRLRWQTFENQHGYPHSLPPEGFKSINTFAESELTIMATRGNTAVNTSLPLTDPKGT